MRKLLDVTDCLDNITNVRENSFMQQEGHFTQNI